MKLCNSILAISGLALTLFLGTVAQKTTDVIRSIDFVASSSETLGHEIGLVNDGNVADNGKLMAQDIQTLAELILGQLESVIYVDNPKPLSNNHAQLVVDALQQSVPTEKTMLQTIIDKHAFALQYLLVGGMVQPIRTLRAALEAYFGAIISLVPTQVPAANATFVDLEDYLEAIVQTYES
ncbi:hypothetical protein GY45DRAFT_1335167 [Cubamyces sp. BRFM 1775]|nr:hypothetical protein GY45DRAFT_1335167 [Cubamyces sp. BRFM 1775]